MAGVNMHLRTLCNTIYEILKKYMTFFIIVECVCNSRMNNMKYKLCNIVLQYIYFIIIKNKI